MSTCTQVFYEAPRAILLMDGCVCGGMWRMSNFREMPKQKNQHYSVETACKSSQILKYLYIIHMYLHMYLYIGIYILMISIKTIAPNVKTEDRNNEVAATKIIFYICINSRFVVGNQVIIIIVIISLGYVFPWQRTTISINMYIYTYVHPLKQILLRKERAPELMSPLLLLKVINHCTVHSIGISFTNTIFLR